MDDIHRAKGTSALWVILIAGGPSSIADRRSPPIDQRPLSFLALLIHAFAVYWWSAILHRKTDHPTGGIWYSAVMTIFCMHILRLVRERPNGVAAAAAGPDVPLHVQLR
jgi:hypothetical protein